MRPEAIYLYKDAAYTILDLFITPYFKNPSDGDRQWHPCKKEEYEEAKLNGVRARRNLVPWMLSSPRRQVK